MRTSIEFRTKINGKFPAPEETDLDELASRFARLIRTGLDRHELICCSTGDWAVPPGIVKTHEYAVLGLKDSRVDLWNPWGYQFNFQPKGRPGYQNGFYFEGGRCSMPLHDFVKIFGRVTIERNPGIKQLGRSRRESLCNPRRRISSRTARRGQASPGSRAIQKGQDLLTPNCQTKWRQARSQ